MSKKIRIVLFGQQQCVRHYKPIEYPKSSRIRQQRMQSKKHEDAQESIYHCTTSFSIKLL